MSHEAFLTNIGQLDIGAETTFGTEAASLNYTYVRTMPIDRSSLTATSFRDEHQRQLDVESSRIVGPHGGTISTQMYLHGFSSTVPSAPPSHTTTSNNSANGFDFVLDILAGAIGNIYTGGFVSNETASTTAILKADSNDMVVGQAVAFQDSSGDWHVNFLTDIDNTPNPDELTLLQTATAVPAGNKIFGSHNIFQTTGSPFFGSTIKSYSLRYTGMADDDRMVMLGAWPTNVTISLPVGELPTLGVDWNVSHWRENTLGTGLGIHSGLASEDGGLSSSGAWAFPTCEAVTNCHVSWGASQATTRQAQGIEVNCNVEVAAIKDPNATSGVGGWYVTKRTPKLTMTVMRDVAEEVTDFFSQTGKTLTAWCGSQAGKLIAVSLPNARIEDWSPPSDTDGAVMQTLTFVANEYLADAGTIVIDTIPGDKQFRLAFL